jgi:hypothetical protein
MVYGTAWEELEGASRQEIVFAHSHNGWIRIEARNYGVQKCIASDCRMVSCDRY